ncbi:hypothetical protein I7I53_01307 [Histoplasma capsulatum var. duboisii H88]|uniref:Uncharacterized protein n=1 Tax=Ajellomyces capsulatus (strain H88) TaxID=544711 RepID=A0A8A1LMR0_AJEC8|nr:hypothetical protein I7I53_01307 [Histoplasma capsulatum var. duboisii H88]
MMTIPLLGCTNVLVFFPLDRAAFLHPVLVGRKIVRSVVGMRRSFMAVMTRSVCVCFSRFLFFPSWFSIVYSF